MLFASIYKILFFTKQFSLFESSSNETFLYTTMIYFVSTHFASLILSQLTDIKLLNWNCLSMDLLEISQDKKNCKCDQNLTNTFISPN